MSDTDNSFNNVQVGDLREALDRNAEVFEPTWEESVLFADAARKTLDPVTDEEAERSMDAFTREAESDATAFDCWKAGLEAFKEGRWPHDRP